MGHRENPDQDRGEEKYQEPEREWESDLDLDQEWESDPDLVGLDQEPCNYTDRVSYTPLSRERESIIQFKIIFNSLMQNCYNFRTIIPSFILLVQNTISNVQLF